MNIWQCSAITIFGACIALSPLEAGAIPLTTNAAALPTGASETGPVVKVQYRHHHRRHYSRHWHHHDHYDSGGAVAAGAIIGLAAGAIAANAAAGNSVGYCASRYRSYDPASGTYLGYDGYRHPCP